jgi:hypothetical protein
VALSGHAQMAWGCLLLGVERTSQALRLHRVITTDDNNSASFTARTGDRQRTASRHRVTTAVRQRADDDAASVEQLSVPVITAIASVTAFLVSRDTLADIKPSFENDTNIVPTPPEQSAFSNCEKVVERDVEMYRKKAQSKCMHYGVRSANVVSYNAQFPAAIKEQQAICGMFDHVALQSVRGRAGFGTSGTA